jgi:hypothetical protein
MDEDSTMEILLAGDEIVGFGEEEGHPTSMRRR